jgi:hypothetical protein
MLRNEGSSPRVKVTAYKYMGNIAQFQPGGCHPVNDAVQNKLVVRRGVCGRGRRDIHIHYNEHAPLK